MRCREYIFLIMMLCSGCVGPEAELENLSADPSHGMKALVQAHNKCLSRLVQKPSSVRVVAVSHVIKGGEDIVRTNEVSVAAGEDASFIFSNLRTDDFKSGLTMHGCSGHMTFLFEACGKHQNISFDHGSGIRSTLMEGAGFRDLPETNCHNLVEFLEKKGFSKREIGVEN